MIRKIMLGLLAFSGGLGVSGHAAEHIVDRIEPPFWWVGMKNDTLQLMVEGKDVGGSQCSVDYAGVKLVESVSLESNLLSNRDQFFATHLL